MVLKKVLPLGGCSRLGILECVLCAISKHFCQSVIFSKLKQISVKGKRCESILVIKVTDVLLQCYERFCSVQCHISLVPIYACARDRRLLQFTTKTVFTALVLCILSYTVTASFGYLTFGSHVRADILSSYSPTPDVLIAVVIIAIKMYTTYPILLYVGR